MTKFEEDLNRRMDLKEVPMYFTQSGCSMTRKTYIETNWVFDTYKNWHSDEEFQDMKAIGGSFALANQNLIDDNKKLVKEITNLKSQLEQQALPVVPECVAEQIERVRNNNGTYTTLGLFDSNYDKKPDYAKWIEDNINEFMVACSVGYTVEKPQLFYLRDELTGQFLAKDNRFKDKDRYFFWTGEDPLTHSIGTAWKLSFTQQEIDSMQTGSYEKIEVVK